MAEALNPDDEAMAGQARRAPVTDMDETGGYRPGVWVWRWVRVNTTGALCKVQTSRRPVAFEALRAPWAGIWVSDG